MRITRLGAVLGAALIVFGCTGPRQDDRSDVNFPNAVDCRTVKLFDKNMESPSSSVPEEWRVFAGHWGKGAWDGKLCHEIVVEAVFPDGTARVVDMQGDYRPWNRWPTAFRRKGRFTEDGSLVIAIGGDTTLTYRHENGIIYGVWNWRTSEGEREVGVTLYPI